MERRLEIGKRMPETGRGHEGCKRKHCKLMLLLREKERTEDLIKEGREFRATNFDDILLNHGYLMGDYRRLDCVNNAIGRIQKQGNCEGIELGGAVTSFVIEEFENPKPLPKPKDQATQAVA